MIFSSYFQVNIMKKILVLMVLMLSGWSGTVTDVRDGNVMTILNNDTQELEVVRLWACDAPEIDQPYGAQSHEFLQQLVTDKEVQVTVKSCDHRGKSIVDLMQGDVHVNKEMVENGCVWLDRQLSGIDVLLSALAVACEGGRGLWADKNAVHPRVWKKINRRSGRLLDAVTVAQSLEHLSRLDPDLLPAPVKSKSAPDLSTSKKIDHP